MANVYSFSTQAHYTPLSKTTGSGQAQAWDTTSTLGGQPGDVKYTLANTNLVYTTHAFTALGSSVTDVRVRWYFDATALTIGTDEGFSCFALQTSTGFSPIFVQFQNLTGVAQVQVQTQKDGGTFNANTQVVTDLGAHWFEVWITRAATDVSLDATTRIYLDSLTSPVATVSSYDLYDDVALMDKVVTGAISGGPIDAGTSGSFNFGKIDVRNDSTSIGAFVGLPSASIPRRRRRS